MKAKIGEDEGEENQYVRFSDITSTGSKEEEKEIYLEAQTKKRKNGKKLIF